ncbi:hypothetical protein MIR68_003779 [Amoeboaphelidium protococcarum]|nr:hypothetical protein MIR68_003779 [Amoeboaphelidium protococcarum]
MTWIVHHVNADRGERRRSSAEVMSESLMEYALDSYNNVQSEDVIFSGFLYKKNRYKLWNKRYFVLSKQVLYYFKSKEDSVRSNKLLAALFLDSNSYLSSDIHPTSDGKELEYFLVITASQSASFDNNQTFVNKQYILKCPSKDEFDGWMSTLRELIVQRLPPVVTTSNDDIDDGHQKDESSIDGPTDLEYGNSQNAKIDAVQLYSNGSKHESKVSSTQMTMKSRQSADNTKVYAQNILTTYKDESVLIPIFNEAQRSIEQFQEQLKSSMASKEPLPNLLELVAIAIRRIRQLLYYADTNVVKSLHCPVVSEFVAKHIATLIESTRKVGFHAKKLAEEQAHGRELLSNDLILMLDDLVYDASIFVSSCEAVADLDEALKFYDKGEFFDVGLLDQLFGVVANVCKFVSTFQKDRYFDICEESLLVSRAFVMAMQNHSQQLNALMKNNSFYNNKWQMSFAEFRGSNQLIDQLRIDIKRECSNACDIWSQDYDFTLAQLILQLALTLVRVVSTLASGTDPNMVSQVDLFWRTFYVIHENLQTQDKVRSVQQPPGTSLLEQEVPESLDILEQKIPVRTLSDRSLSSTFGDDPPSPINPILRDIEATFIQSSIGSSGSVKETSYDVNDLQQRLHDFVMRSPSRLDLPGMDPRKLVDEILTKGRNLPLMIKMARESSTVPSQVMSPLQQSDAQFVTTEFSINQVVAKTIGELSAVVLDASAQMEPLIKKGNLNQIVLDRVEHVSSMVVAACHQIEEELGALEGHFSADDELTNMLDDARQNLSRSVFCYEVSCRNLVQGITLHDASEQVIGDMDSIVQSCGDVVEAVRSLLVHQAEYMDHGLPQSIQDPSAKYNTARPPSPPYTPSHHDISQTVTSSSRRGRAESIDSVLEEDRRLTAEAENQIDALLVKEDEEFNSDQDIVFRSVDGQVDTSMVKAGTLQKLVEKLTYYRLPSSDYISAFLLTYRSFTDAQTLLDLLIDRYNIEPPMHLDDEKLKAVYFQRKIIPVRLRVFNVVKMWVKNNYDDFRQDESLLQKLCIFLPTMRADFYRGVKDFESLLQRKAKGDDSNGRSRPVSKSGSTSLPPAVVPRSITIFSTVLDFDPLEMARQICMLQWDIFVSIQPNECLNQAWNNKKLHHQSPNIRRMIKYSNFLVMWVSTEIMACDQLKVRATTIKQFILLAQKLKSLNNFDGLKSVICGLQASSVRRLKKSWDLVPVKFRQMFTELETLMLEDKSCKNYRQMLHTINPPCIPFLGVYLTDLTMIESGNPDCLKENDQLINFQKRHLIAQVINEMKRYQCTFYNFQVVEQITSWLQSRTVEDNNTLYDKSLILEPR